jgi:uncharacterized protein (DUF58 family)
MQASAASGWRAVQQQVLQRWRSHFERWVLRRIPPARQVRLGHHNIFIMPNSQGLGFMFVLVLMFIGAVNYEANLAFALVFLLVGMFVLSIFHTFRNLSGLHIAAVPGQSVFAGELAELTVILNRHGKRTHESIQLGFPGSRQVVCDLVQTMEQRVGLYVPAQQRGWLKPGRLVIDTVFPFGICRAWSLIDLQVQCLVYPRPIECDLDWLLSSQQQAGNTTLVRGSDDFYSLREYQIGDPLKHVAWKNFARGQGMLIKEYASVVDQKVWLRWDLFPDLDAEGRLSRLCWCVIRLDEAGLEYGLELPGQRIAPSRGPDHYRKLLETLALYGHANPESRKAQP